MNSFDKERNRQRDKGFWVIALPYFHRYYSYCNNKSHETLYTVAISFSFAYISECFIHVTIDKSTWKSFHIVDSWIIFSACPKRASLIMILIISKWLRKTGTLVQSLIAYSGPMSLPREQSSDDSQSINLFLLLWRLQWW